jgi:hypothetical protein
MTCPKCKGRGWTNEVEAAGDAKVEFKPPVMVICECSKGPAMPFGDAK